MVITRANKMKNSEDIKSLIENLRNELGAKIDDLMLKVAEKDKQYELLERRLDDSEQYSRRMCLRINNIPYNGQESEDECIKKIKEEIVKLGVQIADEDIDRAHRVGSPNDKEGKPTKKRQMIVKFKSFRTRTKV